MKKYLVISLLLISISANSFAQSEEQADYFFMHVNAMLTAWQGASIDTKTLGLGIGYELNRGIFDDFPLSLTIEYDVFADEDEHLKIGRIGFTAFPRVSLLDAEGFWLSVGPKIKLHQQYARKWIPQDEQEREGPTVKAESNWHFALAPAIQADIAVVNKDSFNKISFGIFWDPNSLGKSVNKLQYEGQPVYDGQVKSQQIGLMLGYYFR